MQFIDIHTHRVWQKEGVISVQSLSLTADIFLAMPKTKPIAVGLHPWYTKLTDLESLMRYLSVVARQTNVKFIGECGLDKLRGESLAHQLEVLTVQLNLAEHLKKPVILHCVKCFDELVGLKQQLKITVPLVIHGFNKSATLGKQLIAKGFLLSFGKEVLKGHAGVRELIGLSDNFFLETDNSETGIEEIYKAAANLKKCSVDRLKARIFEDWEKLIQQPKGINH